MYRYILSSDFQLSLLSKCRWVSVDMSMRLSRVFIRMTKAKNGTIMVTIELCRAEVNAVESVGYDHVVIQMLRRRQMPIQTKNKIIVNTFSFGKKPKKLLKKF